MAASIFTYEVIAVDFDGTLCEDRYPKIGEPNWQTIQTLKAFREQDKIRIILWTCRTGDLLDKAVEWCKKHELPLDAINENLPEAIEFFGGDTRKIFADVYLDDKGYSEKSITEAYHDGWTYAIESLSATNTKAK